jgi:hypothetical protein
MDEQSVGYGRRCATGTNNPNVRLDFNFGSPFWTSTDTTTITSSQTERVVLIATIVLHTNPWTKLVSTEQKPSKTKTTHASYPKNNAMANNAVTTTDQSTRTAPLELGDGAATGGFDISETGARVVAFTQSAMSDATVLGTNTALI